MKDIVKLIKKAQSVLIFPHIQLDGDALGSSVAICSALRSMGKNADILIEDKIPNNLKFLDKDFCIWDFTKESPDLCIAVDSSDLTRIGKRKDIFLKGKNTAVIDHHATFQPFADFNYVNTRSSATGEIVFELLREMGHSLSVTEAEAVYAAIVTDTGRFMYANTHSETHRIVADLMDIGIDNNKISIEIYQSKRIEKVRLHSLVLGSVELLFDGKCACATMTKLMLKETGAYPEESEGLVEELRSIDGVEIALMLKEEEGGVKVTMRSKTMADVSFIAAQFGGGGHKKAAGCTIAKGIDQVKSQIIDAVGEELDKWKN